MSEPFLRPGEAGYTTTVLTRWGRETYQVWLDESASGWVARIVTLPNRIWAVPGGREAVKFFGPSREEAEQAAARFIEEECIRTNRRIAPPVYDDVTPVVETPVARHGAASGPRSSRPAPRTSRRLLVRFGPAGQQRPGVTANVSETGLFIVTDRPASPGDPVRIDLRFPEGPVPLNGIVVWARQQREEGRSLGFGVRLTERPPEYVKRVRALQTH